MDTGVTSPPGISGRSFRVVYKNEHDQVDSLAGTLLDVGAGGFVVMSVDGLLVVLPNERVYIMREDPFDVVPSPLSPPARA